MDLIALARQMGHAIQEEKAYKDLQIAKTTADNDKELQDLIGEFNLKRMAINNEACKEDRLPRQPYLRDLGSVRKWLRTVQR